MIWYQNSVAKAIIVGAVKPSGRCISQYRSGSLLSIVARNSQLSVVLHYLFPNDTNMSREDSRLGYLERHSRSSRHV